MTSLLRGSVICAFLFSGVAGKLGPMFGLGMPFSHHNVTAAHDVSAQAFGGEVMQRVYRNYASLPVGQTALESAGWIKQNTECDPYLGYAWTKKREGPVKSEPLILYTTKDGLPAGVGTIFRDTMAANQVKWATTNRLVQYYGLDTTWQIDVAFRSADVCTQGAGHSGLGDVLIVNPGGEHTMEIPLTFQQPWVKGSCYDGMGTHSFLNTNSGAGAMPWNSDDLFPVVAMYHEGEINSIFFASVSKQITFPFAAANWWEPITLNNDQMCGNWCDNNCGFKENGNGEWSTMHIYFNDHATVKCSDDLTCRSDGSFILPGKTGCCPQQPGTHASPDVASEELQQILSVLGVLLVGGLAWCFALRARGRRAQDVREVQVSEMASATA